MAAWAALGVRDAAGGALPDYGRGSILLPAGASPAFLIYHNFSAIARYNNADAYVIAVGHLSDRIGGAGPRGAGRRATGALRWPSGRRCRTG